MLEKEIKLFEVENKFHEGVGKNSFEGLENIFLKNVVIDSYMGGCGEGVEEVKRILHYNGPSPEHVKQNIENKLTHITEETARQSFHELLLYVRHDENKQFHYLQQGGTYILRYVYVDEEWKISEIKYDLCWTEGNNYWLKDKKLVDYTPCMYTPIITPKDDAVIRAPYSSVFFSDEQDVMEKMFCYGWVIDTNDFELLDDITTGKTYTVYDGYHNRWTMGAQNIKANFDPSRSKEPCLHHTFRITDVKICGDRAKGIMHRIEPNRIKREFITEDNWRNDWFTLDYDIDLVRENGFFKLEKVCLYVKIYPVKANTKYVHFYDYQASKNC